MLVDCIYDVLMLAFFSGLMSAFVILLMGRTGFRDYIVSNSSIKLFSELFACDFCLSFWCNLACAIGVAFVDGNCTYLLLPFLSTPITRSLL